MTIIIAWSRCFPSRPPHLVSVSTLSFHLNLVFPSQPCLSVSTLSFRPDLVFLIPDLEIETSKAPSTSVGSLFESGHYDIRGWFERHSLVMMTLTADDDDDKVDLLIVKSKSALMCVPIARLKAFCEDNDLTVSPTGKRGPIKKDYVAAVWCHVSKNIELKGNITDKRLHRVKDLQTWL
jgi:hypothetical protein